MAGDFAVGQRVPGVLAALRADPARLTATTAVVGTSAAAWAAVYLIQGTEGMMPTGAGMAPGLADAAAFLAVWVIGMVAMMFPIMLPTVFLYDRLQRAPSPGVAPDNAASSASVARSLASAFFLGSYLSTYALLGVVALVALTAGSVLAMDNPSLATAALYAPPAILLAAGLYQVSPLKRRCLTAMHSPLWIFMKGWRPGLPGALLMGGRHGLYCVGCCWMYMLVMLVVGAMGLFWMAGLALVIAIERSAGERGPLVSKVVAAGLVGAGVLLAAVGVAAM